VTFSIDAGLIVSTIGVLTMIVAALLKNFASISATTSRSIASEARVERLEASLHDFQLATVSTYVTTTTLKENMSMFTTSIDRLTDRLDRLITDHTEPRQ
jgi:hypothetical protein